MATITKPNKRLVDGHIPYASDFNPVFEAVDALCDAVNNQQSPADKQDVLVPGVNIKTINGESILGAGNISTDDPTKQEKLVSGENIKTINGESILGFGNIEIGGSGNGVNPPMSQEEYDAIETKELTLYFIIERGLLQKIYYKNTLVAKRGENIENISFPLTFPFVFS